MFIKEIEDIKKSLESLTKDIMKREDKTKNLAIIKRIKK